MNYILKTDGTFRKLRNIKKKDLNDVKYCLIDISTDRKGPVYTLVENPIFDFSDSDIQIDMDVSYSPIDTPFDDAMLLHSSFPVDSIEKYYNVYPLVNQMYGFNIFRDKFADIDNHINIDTMTIQYNNSKIEIGEYDYFGESLKKIFRSINMDTNVNDVLHDKVILMRNNKWEIHDIDNDMEYLEFDKIGIPISNAESLYILSYKEFMLFQKIEAMSAEIIYYTEPTLYSDGCRIIEDDGNCTNAMYVSEFGEFLESCMFLPQMILMEQNIYDTAVNLRIEVETYDRELSLFITDKETLNPKNVCIYKIIKKLLKM